MHSTDMKVTGRDLTRHIQTLVDLLEDPPQLLRDPAAIQAVVDIRTVIYYCHHKKQLILVIYLIKL